MLKLLLVDDEFLARNAVMMLLSGEGFPVCSVREAVNGVEAIALIEQEPPDLALIDISMPVMGGLALIDWMARNAPQVYSVVVSSYSDFEYVREAMKKGARDYLLKHQLTAGSLLEVFRQSGLALAQEPVPADEKERALEVYLAQETQPSPSLPWITDSLFFVIRPLSAQEELGAQQRSIQKTCKHILVNEDATVCMPDNHSLAFLFPRRDGEAHAQHAKRVKAAQKVLRDAIERYHGIRLTIPEPVRCAAQEDVRLRYQYFQNAFAEEADESTGAQLPTLALENVLTTAVLGNHQDAIAQLIAEPFDAARGDAREEGVLDNAMAALLRRCYGHLLHIEEPVYPHGQARRNVAEYYIQAFRSLAERYQQLTYSGYPELIRKTLIYLNANSGNEVCLSDVAAHVSVNYSYLSYLFKKETGIGITQYVNAVRVGNAMRLILLKNLPITAACQEAGFNQYGHFVSVFKGITGLSPTAFRKHRQAFRYMMEFSPLKPQSLFSIYRS